MKIEYFDVEEFEKRNKNLRLVEDFSLLDNDAPKLYYNNDDNCYYAKGYWAGPKYNYLRYAKIDFINIDTWVANIKETFTKK